MELIEAVRTRRSVRAFKEDEIPRDVIEELVDLAGQAPSSFNQQPWRFHAATGDARAAVCSVLCHTTRFVAEYLATLSDEETALAETFFAELGRAPVVMGVSAPDRDNEIDVITTLLSVGGAMQNLQLAAHDRGLGACALTFTDWVRDDLVEVFGVEDGWSVVSVILLGKPAETQPSPGRRADILDILE